jgi:hypothetical protein
LLHPSEWNWAALRANTIAKCIHFQDAESLRTFKCPDDVHLDARDAPLFTSALVDVFVSRGLFAGRMERSAVFAESVNLP